MPAAWRQHAVGTATAQAAPCSFHPVPGRRERLQQASSPSSLVSTPSTPFGLARAPAAAGCADCRRSTGCGAALADPVDCCHSSAGQQPGAVNTAAAVQGLAACWQGRPAAAQRQRAAARGAAVAALPALLLGLTSKPSTNCMQRAAQDSHSHRVCNACCCHPAVAAAARSLLAIGARAEYENHVANSVRGTHAATGSVQRQQQGQSSCALPHCGRQVARPC